MFTTSEQIGRRNACYLGISNALVETDTLVVASSAAADHEVELVRTWTTFDTWASSGTGTHTITVTLSAARPINAYGIAGHNLDVAGSMQVQYSTNGTSWTILADHAPADTRSLFRVLAAPITARWWRFLFAASAQVYVGHLFLGAALRVPKAPDADFVPPYWDDDDEIMNHQTEGGAFLGRAIIRRGGRTGVQWTAIDARWVRENWRAVLDHIRLNPFWFAWAGGDGNEYHALESAICWTDGRQKGPSFMTDSYASISLDFRTQ